MAAASWSAAQPVRLVPHWGDMERRDVSEMSVRSLDKRDVSETLARSVDTHHVSEISGHTDWDLHVIHTAAGIKDGRFGSKVGQIGPK